MENSNHHNGASSLAIAITAISALEAAKAKLKDIAAQQESLSKQTYNADRERHTAVFNINTYIENHFVRELKDRIMTAIGSAANGVVISAKDHNSNYIYKIMVREIKGIDCQKFDKPVSDIVNNAEWVISEITLHLKHLFDSKRDKTLSKLKRQRQEIDRQIAYLEGDNIDVISE